MIDQPAGELLDTRIEHWRSDSVVMAAAHLLGRADDTDFVLRCMTAHLVVKAAARSYTGRTLDQTTGTLVLAGTRGEILEAGEAPLAAVTAVRLDGAVLDPRSYRWQRQGRLSRRVGWCDSMATVEIDATWGYSGGWPFDLRAILITATARLASNPTSVEYESDGSYETRQPDASVMFTIGELVVLNGYRRRTYA